MADSLKETKRQIAHTKDFLPVLWSMMAVIFTLAVADFFFISVLIQYLSMDVGISDVGAGLLVGLLGVSTVLFSMITGMLADRLSVFGVVFVSAVPLTVGRLVMAFSSDLVIVMVCLLVVIPMSEAMIMPALYSGLKRFSQNTDVRAIACGFNYAVTNLGAIPALVFSDVIRLSVESANGAVTTTTTNRTSTTVGITNTLQGSGRRAVVFVSGLVTSVCVIMACAFYFMFVYNRRGTDTVIWTASAEMFYVSAKTEEASDAPACSRSTLEDDYDDDGAVTGLVVLDSENSNADDRTQENSDHEAKIRVTTWSLARLCKCSFFKIAFPVNSIKLLCSSRKFWSYLGLTVVLANVRALFYHLNMTFPKYSSRIYGKGFPYGIVTCLNPIIVIPLSVVLSAATARADTIKCIIVGTFLCAVSPVFMAIADFPVFSVIFVVLFSIGEATWSPLTTTYMLKMAPDGLVGVFSSMAAIPNCGSKVVMGLFSGFLLENLCGGRPGTRCDGRALWLIVAGLAFVSPVLLWLIFCSCCRFGYEKVSPSNPRQDFSESDLKYRLSSSSSSDSLSEDRLTSNKAV